MKYEYEDPLETIKRQRLFRNLELLRILVCTNVITMDESKTINTLLYSELEYDNNLANQIIKSKFLTS